MISWQEFLRGKRKRKDVCKYSVSFTDNILALHRTLAEKSYKHGHYHAFKINDPKPRDIHKATVRDRVVHHAIYRALYPYFDKKFIYDSYSCRNEKGVHKALNRFQEFSRKVSQNNTQTAWVLKCDIKKFFASIDHSNLKNILSKYIVDKDVLWLLGQIVDSFHTKGSKNIGLPLGNVTSQLLINIYMNQLDQFAKRKLKVKFYIRYSDDFVIFHHEKDYLYKLIPQISTYLQSELNLLLNEKKIFVKTVYSGVDFLGWVHFPHHRVLRTATKRRIFKKLRQNRSSTTVASYLGLLKHGNTYKLTNELTQKFDLNIKDLFDK